MKRLTPPILDVYTDSQLAVELDVPHWKIKTACETGQIKAEFVPARIESKPRTSGPGFVRWCSTREGGTTYSYPAYYNISKNEAERFEAELLQPSVTPEAATGEINPNARKSLLKLVAVLAATGYGYDPTQKKSPIPAQIQNDADLLDISLDVDTIRKWLKESSEYLPRKEEQTT